MLRFRSGRQSISSPLPPTNPLEHLLFALNLLEHLLSSPLASLHSLNKHAINNSTCHVVVSIQYRCTAVGTRELIIAIAIVLIYYDCGDMTL